MAEYSCITYPTLEGDFELVSGFIHLLPKFQGLPWEDPTQHLHEVHVVCSTMKPYDISDWDIKLRAFPFSLTGSAKEWLYYIPAGHITNWIDMKKAFLEEFFMRYKNSCYQQPSQQFQPMNSTFQPFCHQSQNFQQPCMNFQPNFHHFQQQNNSFQPHQFQPSNQGFSQPYGGFQQPLNQGFQGTNFQQPSSNFQASFQHQNPSFQAQNQSQPSFSQSGQIYTEFQQPTYFQDSNSNQEDYGSSSGVSQQEMEVLKQQMQNMERQLGQLASGMNQIQAQRSSTQESEFHEEISATPSSTQISPEMDFTVSRVEFSLEDTLAIQDTDMEPISDAIAVEDVQMGVGDCTEPQGPPLVIDLSEDVEDRYVSVGDCTEPQVSPISSEQPQLDLKPLPEDLKDAHLEENQSLLISSAQNLELEQEPSSVEENKIVEPQSNQLGPICDHSSICHASGTSYSTMDSIHAHHSENVIEVPVFDFVGCDSFVYACPRHLDIVISALSYPTCVWEMVSFVPPPGWEIHLNLLRPPERIFEETISEGDLFTSPTAIPHPGWKILLNRLRPPEKSSKEVKNFKEAIQHIHGNILKLLTSPQSIPLPAWILLLNLLQPPGFRGVCSILHFLSTVNTMFSFYFPFLV